MPTFVLQSINKRVMIANEISCPFCGSTNLLNDGENDFGGTDYYCTECGHDFATED